MWYSNVLIELFQVDISVSEQNKISINKMLLSLIFKEIFRPSRLQLFQFNTLRTAF
jgi:hypothetical protein